MKSIETLLKEQHRNTRYDAVEILNSVWSEYESNGHGGFMDTGEAINEIERRIMNMKQREPDLKSTPKEEGAK